MKRTITVVISLAAALTWGRGDALQAQDTLHVFTPVEAYGVGKQLRDTLVAQYGIVNNAQWTQDVRDVLTKIQAAAAYPGLDLKPTLINDSSMNASAIPGGFVIVNIGFLIYADALARHDAPNNPAVQRERFLGYLGAVLGHETAHLTLGHTNVIVDRAGVRRSASPTVRAAPRPGFTGEIHVGPGILKEARYSQQRELDADRVGALYLLRTGGQIQYAMDFWRASDSTEREEGSPYRLMVGSYVSSHPRASTREAALEAFRAKLKLHQTRYDDALTFIRANAELDAAIALLDTVLVDFPDLVEARHLRGTAYHQKWLNSVPVQTQQLRSSLATYVARFIPNIRGAPGDPTLLAKARQDYERVLSTDILAYTQSNLALLDAYAGDFPNALRRGEDAVKNRQGNWKLMNNYGVILFLAGRLDSAQAMFTQAATAWGEGESPTIAFNQAKTLSARNAPGASQALEHYLTLDGASEWRRAALALLGRTDDRVAGSPGEPPAVMNVRLGSSYEEMVAGMGRPDDVRETETGTVYHYNTLGIVVFVTSQYGVTEIAAGDADAGAIDGLRVGTPWSAVTARWGAPAQESDGTSFFLRGTWIGYASQENGVVSWIGMQIKR